MTSLRMFVLLILMFLMPVLLMAQVLTIEPEKPRIGEPVTITYNAKAPEALLKGTTDLQAQVLLISTDGIPTVMTVPLTEHARGSLGTFVLRDGQTRLLAVNVEAESKKDDNGGNSWTSLVYGSNGQPLENANVAYANFLTSGGMLDFSHERDYPSALGAVAAERARYPSNWRAFTTEWTVLMRQSRSTDSKPEIRGAVDSCFHKFGNNDTAVSALLYWLRQVGETARADSLQQAAILKQPHGVIALGVRQSAISAERDPGSRAALLERLLEEFSLNRNSLRTYQGALFSCFVQLHQLDSALAVAERISDLRTDMFNEIAWNWIEKGENLEKAVALAKRGVDEATDPPDSLKPSYVSSHQWKDYVTNSRAMVLDTYGFGLSKLGRTGEAEVAFGGAYHATRGDSPDITERYIATLMKEGKYEEAVAVGKEVLEMGKSNESILGYFKEAYTKVHGSTAGMDEQIAASEKKADEETRSRVAQSRISKPAIPFTLKGLDGKEITLSDLKGKVVVIDFWATWCGPCKRSFPAFQKVYDHYAGNSGVQFLALDTWEHVAGEEREQVVKKFIAENKYTFPVLYDTDVVDRYGVDGIPTKFIIDKAGNIAFKSVGFTGENEMTSELTAQIEMLLGE